MYVVLTLAELTLFCEWGERYGAHKDSSINNCLNLSPCCITPESTGLPVEILEAYELTLTESVARQMGIIAPRGEYWIEKAFDREDFDTLPRAIAPKRVIPKLGKTFEPRVCPFSEPRITEPDQEIIGDGPLIPF